MSLDVQGGVIDLFFNNEVMNSIHSFNCRMSWTFLIYFFMEACCSVTKSDLTICDPMDCSTPGFPVLPCLPEFAQTHVHCVGDAIQPSLLPPPSPPGLNLPHHQGLFQ